MIGYTIDGGYAEQVAVPAPNVFVLPEGTRPEEAVMLASAVPSAVRAVRRADIRPGQRIAVIGAGSIGDLVAQVARASGAHVVLADTDPRRLDDVSGHAATTIRLPSGEGPDSAAARLREAIGDDRGADVVFEAAGTRDALELALSLTRPGGTLMAVGLPPGSLSFPDKTVREAVIQEITIRGTFAYSRTDFPQVIALFLGGHLDLSATIAEPVLLEDVPRVAEHMFHAGTAGRRHPVLLGHK
jgi:threonine dehydrogenase-like Zn-dependent dehydrogenase